MHKTQTVFRDWIYTFLTMTWSIADCLSGFCFYAHCLLQLSVSFDQVPTWPIAPIWEFNGNKEESQSELIGKFHFLENFQFSKIKVLETAL